MKLKGKNAIITGANQGLGLEIAKEYVKEGASIAICARDIDKLRVAQEQLQQVCKNVKIVVKKVDVADENEVKLFLTECKNAFEKIDVLVNNAGIYGPKGCIEDIDSKEWLNAIQINLMGTFYMCKHIIGHMKENRSGKIINLSGGGATTPLPRISSYAASKAAVVRLTETLALECAGYGIDINAIAPGALNTRLLDEVLQAGPDVVGKNFYEKSLKQKESGGTSLEKGAQLCVYLASEKSNGITGKLISAVWDKWDEFEKHIDDIKKSDVFTLRRIVPNDRNLPWS